MFPFSICLKQDSNLGSKFILRSRFCTGISQKLLYQVLMLELAYYLNYYLLCKQCQIRLISRADLWVGGGWVAKWWRKKPNKFNNNKKMTNRFQFSNYFKESGLHFLNLLDPPPGKRLKTMLK